METGKRSEPYRSFNFRIEIDQVTVAAFSECSGLTIESDAIDYREGTDKHLRVHKLVGLYKLTNIMLKRGYTQNTELWNWYSNILNGVRDRRGLSIILMDEQRKDVMRWHVENAWIHKIEGPGFKASGNEVAIESVEIVHEGLTLEPVG